MTEQLHSTLARLNARKQVKANKEVIVCGGAIGSPNILMHSGVGPRDVLAKAGVPVRYHLPGVGQHLQDHISTQVVFNPTPETRATLHNGQSGNQVRSLLLPLAFILPYDI